MTSMPSVLPARPPAGLSKSNLLYLVAYYSVDVDARKCALTGMEGSPRGTAQCVFQANITVRGRGQRASGGGAVKIQVSC